MEPLAKRRKIRVPQCATNRDATEIVEAEESEDILADASLFALDSHQELNPQLLWPGSPKTSSTTGSNKQIREDPLLDSGDALYEEEDESNETDAWLAQLFPELYPSVPGQESRTTNVNHSNPFAVSLVNRHPCLKATSLLPDDGAVNGYIKFRFRMSEVEVQSSTMSRKGFFGATHTRIPQQQPNQIAHLPSTDIPYLPANFGRGLKLDDTDRKLFKFYLTAYCQGRTLLPKTNFWISNIAPMAVEDECVKHALLALAGAYVLDYLPSPQLLARINSHYQRAVSSITKALSQGARGAEKSDCIVSALSLLIVDDCINWELRGSSGALPNWYLGGRLAKSLLDESDPGYRYYKPVNVQCSSARLANANWGAFACIVAQPVMALDLCAPDQTFDWLLAGTKRDSQKIHGSTGLCPKLLHTFAQVTHLTIRMARIPDSVALPYAANKIKSRLDNMHQWSELSPGYPSVEALLKSCKLDTQGKVTSAAMVTDLTGEIWIATVQMYLQCRFFRRQRSHPLVQQFVQTFGQCLRRMPYSGPLFTSQAPFCCIFLMSLVAYHSEDRGILRDWFETIVSNVGARSSVPPVWEAVKRLWIWTDTMFSHDCFDEGSSVGERIAWWEVMVAHIIDTEEYISLI